MKKNPIFVMRISAMTHSIAASLLILFAAVLSSCSNSPRRKISEEKLPEKSRTASDGTIKPRSSAENKKRVEHYNSLQHR